MFFVKTTVFLKTFIYSRISLVICLFTFPILLSSCNNDIILANVGESTITQSSFTNRYEDYLAKTSIRDNLLTRKEVLNNMISEVLLNDCDDNSKVSANPDYVKELQWIDNQVILAYLKDIEIYQKINVTDKEIRQAFLRSNQKIAARHLYAKTEEEIKSIAELLKIGVNFNTLAKQTFTDSTLKNNGGYLGYFSWGDMDPEFENVVYSLKIGEVSDPIKLENGYSIAKLEDKVSHPILTESEYLNKKSKLAQVLRINKKRPAENNFMNNAINLNEIKFVDAQIEKIWKAINLNITSSEVNESELDDVIAVIYRNLDYTSSDLINKIKLIPQFHSKRITSKEKLKTIIKGLILQEKLLEIASQKGYPDMEVVEAKLESERTNLLMKYKISEILEDSIIDDSLLLEFYNSNQNLFSSHDRINVQEILVYRLEEAKDIIDKLNQNIDFAKLAKEHSIRKETADNDGIIGLKPSEKYGNLKSLFAKSNLNEILGPIEIENIYGIFKVIDRVGSEIKTFEEVKDEVSLAVKYQYRNDLVKNYIEDLKKKNDVIINIENLSSLKIALMN